MAKSGKKIEAARKLVETRPYALPEAVPARVVAEVVSAPSPIEFAPPPATVRGCTPGHCRHRSGLARRRCKRRLQEAFLGFPEEFDRPPLGARLHEANFAQVRNGEAAASTFYEYDFEPDGARLNVRGRDKLATISARLPMTFDPVIVERTGRSIDESRREHIFTSIAAGPFPIPPSRVLVGPVARGLRGEEAERINVTALSRTALGGPPIRDSISSSASPAQGVR